MTALGADAQWRTFGDGVQRRIPLHYAGAHCTIMLERTAPLCWSALHHYSGAHCTIIMVTHFPLIRGTLFPPIRGTRFPSIGGTLFPIIDGVRISLFYKTRLTGAQWHTQKMMNKGARELNGVQKCSVCCVAKRHVYSFHTTNSA